jgi:hypothetical protein
MCVVVTPLEESAIGPRNGESGFAENGLSVRLALDAMPPAKCSHPLLSM